MIQLTLCHADFAVTHWLCFALARFPQFLATMPNWHGMFFRALANLFQKLLILLMSSPPTAKTVLVGDSGVGKTSIVSRMCENKFPDAPKPTVASNFKDIEISSGTRVLVLNIWDTAGQESYRSLTPIFFKDAVISILVYDISKKASLQALPEFYAALQEHAPRSVCAVVGNKADLASEREVTYEEGSEYAKEIGACVFCETSALTGQGITELFQNLVEQPNLYFPNLDRKDIVSEPLEKKPSCRC